MLEKKVKLIKVFIFILILIFFIKVLYLVFAKIHLPPKTKEIKDRALRGSIISSDGYIISRSIKKWSASIHTAYLDPKKKDFFLTLFSIYTNIPKKELEKKFFTKDGKKKRGWILLAKDLDAKTVIFLKDLKYKLNRFKVFRAPGINKNFYYGLTLTPTGEAREYPLHETLSPILGYTRDKKENGYTKIVGFNGIEKYYDKYLNNKIDGYISGKRDVVGNIIFDKNVKFKKKRNGYNLVLNISLKLQKTLDVILDNYKEKLHAKEIIAAVMRSEDSKIIAMTSSNRYDPLHIKADEIENLQPKMISYPYEPGSVLKPITYAIALEKGIITPQTIFPTFNGKMWVGGFKITDDEPFNSLSALDIIVHSSNIGISQIAWKIGRKDFRNGLIRFGLGALKSGIDIGNEKVGKIYSLKQLRYKTNFATTSYGYGIHATFAQLLKAYNCFNNDGYSLPPRVVNYLTKPGSQKKFFVKKDYTAIRPISAQTAQIVKDTLKEVVQRGTGVAAKIEGLEIGGKTGTAMIYENGKYQKEYHASFYGFVNDKNNHKYTIGVLVIRPDYAHHFASQSAVPVFREIVNALIDNKLLEPDLSFQKQKEKEAQERAKEQKIKELQRQKAKAIKERLRKEREKIQKEELKAKKQRRKPSFKAPLPAPNEPDLF